MKGFQYIKRWPCTWCNGIQTSVNQYLIHRVPAIINEGLLSHLTPKSITWERFFLVQFWYGVSITASFQRVRCLLIYWYWVLAVSRSMISKQRTPISNWKGKAVPLTDHQFTICTIKTGPPDIIFNKLFSTMTSPFFCYFAWQVQYFSGVFYTFELSFSFYSFPFLNAAELRLFAQNWVPYCLRVLASQTPTPLLIIFAIHILRWTIVRFTSTRRHRPQASWPTSPIHLWICPRGSCCSRFSPWSPFR